MAETPQFGSERVGPKSVLAPGDRVYVKHGGDALKKLAAGDQGKVVSVNSQAQSCLVEFDGKGAPIVVAAWHLVLVSSVEAEAAKLVKSQSSVREKEEEAKRQLNEAFDAVSRPPFVERQAYSSFSAALAVINLLFLGIEADYKCRHRCSSSELVPFEFFEHLLTALCLVDVGVRIYNYGLLRRMDLETGHSRMVVPAYFAGGTREVCPGLAFLHWVDVTVVLLRVVDTWVLTPNNIETRLRLLSMLRIFHMARWIRLVQMVRTFRELWLIIAGIKDTFLAVGFVASLLSLVMLAVAVVITILVRRMDDGSYDFSRSRWPQREYWGTVPKSMYSLFQVMTFDNWYESMAGPLIKRDFGLLIIFAGFLCVSTLCLLNLIVGVVVESTVASAMANREKEGKERERIDKIVMDSLQLIFEEADTDKSGDLDRRELQRAMKRDYVNDRLTLLDINPQDLELLFGLLDADEADSVPTERFFRGCGRLRGPAMSADLHHMSVDLQRCIGQADKLLQDINRNNRKTCRILYNSRTADVGIIVGEDDEEDPVLMNRRKRFIKHPDVPTAPDVSPTHGHESRQTSKDSKGYRRRTSLVSHALRATAQDVAHDQPPPPDLPTHLQELRIMSKESTGSHRRTTTSGREHSHGRSSVHSGMQLMST